MYSNLGGVVALAILVVPAISNMVLLRLQLDLCSLLIQCLSHSSCTQSDNHLKSSRYHLSISHLQIQATMSTGITHYSLRSIIVSAAIQKLEAVVTSNLSAPASTVEFWLDNGATAEQAADWGDLIWQNTPSYVADLINHYATEWKNSKAE